MITHTTADYDVDEPWLQVGTTSWLPVRFRVTRSVGPRARVPDVVVVVHVELIDAAMAAGVTLYEDLGPTPAAKMVSVSRTYGEVLERDVRDVPVVELIEDGVAALTRPTAASSAPGQLLDRGGVQIRRVKAPQAPSAALLELRSARQPLQRSKLDLGLVAHAYQEAQGAGRRDTTIAVAERIGLSRSRAADYLREARRLGLLPSVTARRGPSADK